MDYVVGVDIPAFNDGRVNCNIARRTADHDPPSGGAYRGRASILLNTRLAQAWEAEALLRVDAQAHRFHVPPEGDLVCARTGGLLSVWTSSVATPPVCSAAIRIGTGLYRGTLVLLEHRSSSRAAISAPGVFGVFPCRMVSHVPFPGLRDVFLRSVSGCRNIRMLSFKG
jgi:hypothetical protein